MLIKRKDWDSIFFGYEIYELKYDNMNEDDLQREIAFAKEQKATLIYLVSKEEKTEIESLGGQLVDKKVLFRKAINQESYQDPNIGSFSKNDNYELLLPLALASGIYSRFNRDKNFRQNEFERLYEEWIRRSVSREISSEVLAYYNEEKILGMTTISLGVGEVSIGLIAVSDEHKGKNIGSRLLNAVANYAINNNCKIVKVPTQKHNIPACKFYMKNGFQVLSEENIYHYWV
jgi:dTDP-4-amino-4,6-dideoxy-D-galactose acyltransferase